MDGRDGVAPVALTADEPIPQAVFHRALPLALLLETLDDGLFAF